MTLTFELKAGTQFKINKGNKTEESYLVAYMDNIDGKKTAVLVQALTEEEMNGKYKIKDFDSIKEQYLQWKSDGIHFKTTPRYFDFKNAKIINVDSKESSLKNATLYRVSNVNNEKDWYVLNEKKFSKVLLNKS